MRDNKQPEVLGIYVYAQIEGVPIIAGRLEYRPDVDICVFYYGNSYLSNPKAYALDPINLPLNETVFQTQSNRTRNSIPMFGVFLDAGPDDWGKNLIHSLHKQTPKNALELLVVGNGQGVGSLLFSMSRASVKMPEVPKNHIESLDLLDRDISEILKSNDVSREAKKIFEYGISMGGARPKTALEIDGTAYLAKFNKESDLVDVCSVEHASMLLAHSAGIRTAKTKLHKTKQGKSVLLVERFDRDSVGNPLHYISAHALMNLERISPKDSLAESMSYAHIASKMKKISPKSAHQAKELFRRMVFNILIGNSDDHSRNHGFIRNEQGEFELSRAFDIVVQSGSNDQQGMFIGVDGDHLTHEASLEIALSSAGYFSLSEKEAKSVIQEVMLAMSHWKSVFLKAGVSVDDIAHLEGFINFEKIKDKYDYELSDLNL